jgi:hypothetical protein
VGRDINIHEIVEDATSWYNIKRFKISNTIFERPEKSIDSKSINQDTFNSLIKNKHELKFHEATKNITSFDDILKVGEHNEPAECNAYFLHKKWLTESLPNILSITFQFNPFNFVNNIDKIDWFFDRYYEYSKLFISVPNVRMFRMLYKPQRKETIMTIDRYIEFVDSVYSILQTRNSKPIFTPVSLRMSLQDLDKLIDHYLKKEYFYYWFDFEGKAINEYTISSIRHVFNKIQNKGYFKKIIAHFTNIKREIISNSSETEIKSPASDVLASIAGANIVGIDREPPKKIESLKVTKVPKLRQHKSRIFDRDSYYYVKNQKPHEISRPYNIAYNSVELDKEFKEQAEFFLKNNSIDTFLAKKEMLTNYRGGSILKQLNSKIEKVYTTSDWL